MSFLPPNELSLSLGASFFALGLGARTPTERGVDEEVEATAPSDSVEVGALSYPLTSVGRS